MLNHQKKWSITINSLDDKLTYALLAFCILGIAISAPTALPINIGSGSVPFSPGTPAMIIPVWLLGTIVWLTYEKIPWYWVGVGVVALCLIVFLFGQRILSYACTIK